MSSGTAHDCPTVCIAAADKEQACSLVSSTLEHLLFAKGQIGQPMAVLRRRRSQPERSDDCRGDTKLPARMDRKKRDVGKMLSNAEKLHFDVKTAVDLLSHEQQMVSSSSKDVTFLLRMGQSPVSLAKHQYIVHCQGILGLPEVQGAPAPIQTHRQPFGKKIGHSSKSADTGTKQAALERKLIRFLLYASQEDSIHGKTLSAQLAPTKLQLFLLAPSSFSQKEWAPKALRHVNNPRDTNGEGSSLKKGLEQENMTTECSERGSLHKNQQPDLGNSEYNIQSLRPTEQQDIQPISSVDHVGKTWEPHNNGKDGGMSHGNMPQNKHKSSSFDDERSQCGLRSSHDDKADIASSVDAKRVARLQSRSSQRVHIGESTSTQKAKSASRRLQTSARGRSRHMPQSATLILNFVPNAEDGPSSLQERKSGQGEDDTPLAPLFSMQNQYRWFANRTILHGCRFK